MSTLNTWRKRWLNALRLVVNLLWVFLVCLLSELAIWGLSRALALAHLEFFAPILGMLLVFASMMVIGRLSCSYGQFYNEQIRPKIDFINAHLGVGFPIPIIMTKPNDMLHTRQIALIIGTFLSTNVVSWTTVYFLPLLILTWAGILKTWASSPYPALPLWANKRAVSRRISPGPNPKPRSSEIDDSPSRQMLQERCDTVPEYGEASTCHTFSSNWPSIIIICGIFAIGLPVALGTEDERLLDGFVMVFIWTAAVRLQRLFRLFPFNLTVRIKSILATLANPVLATTLLLVAYTRAKAATIKGRSLSKVLTCFSGGTPLYALWTSKALGIPIPGNPLGWFGPGDAALSILECGILTWGFKLYECQRQVFSLAGVLTVIFSVAAAAGNVFLSVLAGHIIGLDRPEALAFAARSTTLGLARPAILAVGGNAMVNATLVVSNGILGQLMYPFVLDKLRLQRVSPSGIDQGGGSCEALAKLESSGRSSQDTTEDFACQDDDALTVAAGIAIGVNGAAMGVSYLYEKKSRAAPYAALSMTVFGVMTVVFTTVDPFKSYLMSVTR